MTPNPSQQQNCTITVPWRMRLTSFFFICVLIGIYEFIRYGINQGWGVVSVLSGFAFLIYSIISLSTFKLWFNEKGLGRRVLFNSQFQEWGPVAETRVEIRDVGRRRWHYNDPSAAMMAYSGGARRTDFTGLTRHSYLIFFDGQGKRLFELQWAQIPPHLRPRVTGIINDHLAGRSLEWPGDTLPVDTVTVVGGPPLAPTPFNSLATPISSGVANRPLGGGSGEVFQVGVPLLPWALAAFCGSVVFFIIVFGLLGTLAQSLPLWTLGAGDGLLSAAVFVFLLLEGRNYRFWVDDVGVSLTKRFKTIQVPWVALAAVKVTQVAPRTLMMSHPERLMIYLHQKAKASSGNRYLMQMLDARGNVLMALPLEIVPREDRARLKSLLQSHVPVTQ